MTRLKVLHFFIKNVQHYFYQTFVINRTSIKIYSFFSRFTFCMGSFRFSDGVSVTTTQRSATGTCWIMQWKKIASHFYFGDTNYEMRIPRETFSNKNYYKLSAVVVCRWITICIDIFFRSLISYISRSYKEFWELVDVKYKGRGFEPNI